MLRMADAVEKRRNISTKGDTMESLPAVRFCFLTLGWLCVLAAVAGPMAIAATVDDVAAVRPVVTVFVSRTIAAGWHFLIVVVLDLLARIAESADEQRELIRDIGADVEWFKERAAKP